jgi:hypothetical protein
MEPGKIRLINSGGQSDAGFTQTIADLGFPSTPCST